MHERGSTRAIRMRRQNWCWPLRAVACRVPWRCFDRQSDRSRYPGPWDNTRTASPGVLGAVGCGVHRLADDLETGKAVLRDCIEATIGFDAPGAAIAAQPSCLVRMFAPGGNPQVRTPFPVIGQLQNHAGLQVHVVADAG